MCQALDTLSARIDICGSPVATLHHFAWRRLPKWKLLDARCLASFFFGSKDVEDSIPIPCAQILEEFRAESSRYCGWKKSCTTLDGWNPTKNGINHLSTGAGFPWISSIHSLSRFNCWSRPWDEWPKSHLLSSGHPWKYPLQCCSWNSPPVLHRNRPGETTSRVVRCDRWNAKLYYIYNIRLYMCIVYITIKTPWDIWHQETTWNNMFAIWKYMQVLFISQAILAITELEMCLDATRS